MNTETRFRELRAQGRRLTGTVMRYGDVATIAGSARKDSPCSRSISTYATAAARP